MSESEQIIINPEAPCERLRARIVGVGGAGCSVVEHISRTDLGNLPLAIVHTHARVLQQRSISNRILVGVNRCHGLGCGGDPELARIMAESDRTQLTALSENTDLLFVVCGLGGGTGTGIAPVVAKMARDSGALVLALAIMPFDFEGPKRQKQSQFGLQMLRSAADLVLCVPNQKIRNLLDQNATILEAFAQTNDLFAHAFRGIWQMLTQPAEINVDFSHLSSLLRGRHTECAVAFAEAQGENRASELIARVLEHPLLDSGKALAEAEQIIVSLVGPQDLRIQEIERIVEQLNGHVGNAQLTLGTAIDSSAGSKISITLITSKNGKTSAAAVAESLDCSRQNSLTIECDPAGAFIEDSPAPRPAPRFVAPPPESTPENTRELLERQPTSRLRRSGSKWKQEMLALEIVSRGRFEKSEPTIHRGADLDVPTYIRRGVPLN
jgi:cell division protein FtsZ